MHLSLVKKMLDPFTVQKSMILLALMYEKDLSQQRNPGGHLSKGKSLFPLCCDCNSTQKKYIIFKRNLKVL